MTATRFMRVAEEFSNVTALLHFGTEKLYLMLDVPAEEYPNSSTFNYLTTSKLYALLDIPSEDMQTTCYKLKDFQTVGKRFLTQKKNLKV